MEPSLLDDGEFWLPPEFLTEEDFLVEKENKGFKGIDNADRFGLGKDCWSKFLFPYESRSGFGPFGVNSVHSCPVESLVGSTETESDQENFIAGLTRQMAHSTLEDYFSGGFCGHHNLLVDNNTKSGSPQTTLCAAGISCGCRRRSAQSFQSRVPSPAAWDKYCSGAEEMARTKTNDDPYLLNHSGRGLLGPPIKPSPVLVTAKTPAIGSGYCNHPSLPYHKLQAIQFQHLKQQQIMKDRQQVMPTRGRDSGNNGRPVGLLPSAWTNLQHAQQQRDGSCIRAVILGNPTVKRRSTGTGVFLPRRVTPTSAATTETRKKQTVSMVLLPARVAQALNLNLDDLTAQPTAQPRFDSPLDLNDGSFNNGRFCDQKRRGTRTKQLVPSNESRLPSDWSY